MQPGKQLNSILVKPAGPDCNMACEYCFYLKKKDLFTYNKVHRMSIEILEETIRQAMTQGGRQISFGWQGGEPTLMGISFFEKAVELQQLYGRGQSVGNGLQTNGVLLNKEWAKFLKKYNFLVGLSLDGTEHIHNKYRHFKNGKGSWKRVVDGAKLMLDSGVAVNALSVVNNYSVKFPQEIYQFHKSLGFDFMQFIPIVETDVADPKITAPFSVTAEGYGDFLCRLFDLWQADFVDGIPTKSIRYFDSLFFTYVDLESPECTLLKECGTYVVVEHNGDVYSCDFFVEPEWKLGNIMQDDLTILLNSDRQSEFGKMKSTIPEDCKNCKWLKHCWGGCVKDRIRDPGDNGHNHFCESYKMFFEHADARLHDMAKEWKRKQELALHEKEQLPDRKIKKIKIGRNDPCPCGSGKKYKNCCGKCL